MSNPTIKRQQLVEVVDNLPDEVLLELASFLDYLRYKTTSQKVTTNDQSSFLFSVTGIGQSGQQNVSARDEEILRTEIDPVYGWGSNQSTET